MSELGRALGMPRSSVHRLLATLARRGLLERVGRGSYRPGLGLVALGLGVLDREPVVAAARPVLEEQAAHFGETVFLTAAHRGCIRVLDKAEGPGFLRAAPPLGGEVPVHATAAGKLWLAFDPEAVALPEQPEVFTARTLAGAALQAEVARTRAQGFAENHGEWIEGLSVLAAPIRGRLGLAGALALAAPTPRLASLGREAAARRMVAAADRVAERLARPQANGTWEGAGQ